MEERVGPLTFFSNFDSGNLAKVERVKFDEELSDKEDNNNLPPFIVPDYEYNAWTWPDAVGTEYENLNRTWFYFGVKGGTPGRLLKINMMNLNRQGKLYTQGMSPFVKVVPGRNKWERIRDRPTFETVDGQFHLSFTYRFPDQRNSVHFFAFCYPYSYAELQTRLQGLDKMYTACQHMSPSSPKSSVYFHRELLCNTLDGLRVDLITLTSCKGMLEEKEERLPKLFPDLDTSRAFKFEGKKVFFLSARVHPGETPSSFVFDGFLDFLLRTEDPRAAALRDQYVFKMIPMLNPDGVKRGHYRTDPRGVNLNRVYLEPDPILHPSIFAAKSVITYYHNMNACIKLETQKAVCTCGKSTTNGTKSSLENMYCTTVERTECFNENGSTICNNGTVKERFIPTQGMESSHNLKITTFDDSITVTIAPDVETSKSELERTSDENGGNDKQEKGVAGSSKISSAIIKDETTVENGIKTTSAQSTVDLSSPMKENITKQIDVQRVNENKNDLEDVTVKKEILATPSKSERSQESSEINNNKEICSCFSDNMQPESRLAYYVDLHGHASKRGCFVYANYMENEEDYIRSILFPKLISMNSANFDFTGCNFTEKNMYTKDKRDGISKEGSGRVAVFKTTAIVHSYTLECNYNGGRMLNPVPPATCDSGRATPPPLPGFPPKFTTEIFEEVGRALAVAALDMNNSNPWTRLPLSEFGSLEGVRNWVRRFVKSAKNAPSVPRKLSRAAAKTSSIVAGATATTRQKIGLSFKSSSSSSDLSSDSLSAAAQKITERMMQSTNGNKEAAAKRTPDDIKPPKRIQALVVPRRLSQPVTGSPGKLTDSSKLGPSVNSNMNATASNSGSHQADVHNGGAVVPLRTQFKSKEQARVSLELPKTCPSLRIPRPNQPLAASIKARCCPPELRIGGNVMEIHSHLIGPQTRTVTASRSGGGSASDEEKKKKATRLKKRNARRKEKTDEPARSASRYSEMKLARPREVEPLVNGALKKIPEVTRKGSGRPLLQRSNSKNKNTINCTMRSCEVVDITELPHSPQTGNQAVAYWIDA